jgi:Arc/MetJ family transcription regulator
MKTTVNIPDDVLEDAMRLTHARTKRDAIVAAMEDYVRRKRMAELVRYSGTSTTFLGNEEIEALDRKRSR